MNRKNTVFSVKSYNTNSKLEGHHWRPATLWPAWVPADIILSKRYQGIDTIAEVSASGTGGPLETEREIGFAEANGGPHGFDAAGCDAVEAGCSDLDDQPVSTQFGDQTGGLVGSASGFPVIRGRGVEQLGLEVTVAEA